ncbi:GTPase-activating protein CdGAPr isoform X1 [Tribolium castaneum]|nr:PREDICTED: GTPase-activating protein CdGAPr isoform X1 [Tribolium castaneum]|eukprot:XP_015837773.1 PREDICTED: GTPase-activating protein CdGAPr isoform X1 [Tribolium castaneum]
MTCSCFSCSASDDMFCVNFAKALCTETYTTDMQISEAAGGAPAPGVEPCRFPKLEECAHFHYERVQLPKLIVTLQTNIDQSLHSQHSNEDDTEWYMVQVTSGDECWLLQRNLDNFKMLDDQLHQCIYDRKIFQLPDLSSETPDDVDLEMKLKSYLERFSEIADNSVNCGPVLNWLQMDNKGHRLLVPSEESRSINTPAVAAAYSVRRYVSQARDELNLEVGDMISVIDMAAPGESMWWRGKRGFQVGFFPQHCVHIIGDKVPRNMPLPPPVVGSLALTPIKPVLRKHGKLITFFRSFILNRPSRRRLKQSGILKERVFGCDLGEHLLNSGHDIPMVLKCCAEFIEKHGIVDGIYRLSGVTSNIQKLRNAFDEDRIPNLYTEDILQDIHSVASLLKMYFRELPNPLCTYQLYQSFVNAVQGCNSGVRNSESDHDRLLKMREAVQKLPPPHYRTLEYLMRHLANVAKHGISTGMTTRNVAIVWAPNLLRCAELEVGGVAALQGVGVQAVVTEFLICYAHLIFCDHLPNLDLPNENESNFSPKKCRPKSLAISTPTKLITLEEARTKRLLNKNEDCNNYIEVGGGPKNLPKKYHTVIELPSGGRKRGHKRSPLGWRSLFSKAKNNSQGNLSKPRKASTPGIIVADKSVTESDLTDMKRKLRSVKSAESLTSGHSEPTGNEIDGLGPLYSLNKPPGHNRSVSHDSYFDTLQTSQNNSEGSLLDLSEIQLNFELEESEMRIFSEDESLVSSPRIQKDGYRRILTRARPEEFSSATNSGNPSPKKQARVVLSPDSMSRKRTRLEDQLSDIQYIDCTTPDNMVCTMAVVHTIPPDETVPDSYQPKNKSPRNSDNLDKRQSLNLERETGGKQAITKSFTEVDIGRKWEGSSLGATPTPQSPGYRQLGESSTNTTPDYSPTEVVYQNLNNEKKNNNYENILTTISITYKSPPRSIENSPIKTNADSVYENVIVNVEKAMVPTSTASLPSQEATQPVEKSDRPKSMSALDDTSTDATLKPNLSSSAICDTSEQISLVSFTDSNQSSRSNVQYTPSLSSGGGAGVYHVMENSDRISPTDLSLSEVVHSSTENLSSASFPLSYSKNSTPNVSPSVFEDDEKTEDLIEFSPTDKRKSPESETIDSSVYQQVKFFRRSIHEVNALLELEEKKEEEENYDSLESHVYENVKGEEMKNEEKVCVKDLTSRFEEKQENSTNRVKKFYEKDSLPPCLRARNLKNQLKTRSLDEEEFKKEFGNGLSGQRRKSMDEGLGYKTNSLPKTLNPPKVIPMDDVGKLDSIHLAHSTEDEELKKRERIEKYKEERRKYLADKYRSESFKEDKDVLLSKLKIYKTKDSLPEEPEPAPPRTRRKSSTSVEEHEKSTCKPKSENLKARAAVFEPANQRLNNRAEVQPNKVQECKNNFEDFVRKKDDDLKYERRRHTFESREREGEERLRRVSLESPRKEKAAPTYCIKDMKAIFESKSKQ